MTLLPSAAGSNGNSRRRRRNERASSLPLHLAQGSSVHPAGGGCGVTADWFEDHLPTISLWLLVFLLIVFLWPLAWAAATGEFLPNWAYDEDAWAIDLALRLHSALS